MNKHFLRAAAAIAALVISNPTFSAVSAEEAALLRTTLTPLGAERVGNQDGSIPAWTGGSTTLPPAQPSGGRRSDPYAAEKPLFTVTVKNMDQHAERLSEGIKAMLKKYPDSFRLDVYPSHRSAGYSQTIYDQTFKNATRAKVVEGPAGPMLEGGFGGAPFPIPKTGVEVMLNHTFKPRAATFNRSFSSYMMSADNRWLKVLEATNEEQFNFYGKEGALEISKGDYATIRSVNSGPPIRAGEAIVARQNLNEEKTSNWIYLTGQRRVRKVPNACCDTPTQFSAGIVSFDEIEVWAGRMDRFDWKLIGKKEVFVPYNTNRFNVPTKDSDVLVPGHLNPDHVRWELHRMWVVDATLREGKRHSAVRSRYYVDEDSWAALLAERYDSKGQLWRVPFLMSISMPDVPAQGSLSWGVYDLVSGQSFFSGVFNEQKVQGVVPAMSYAPNTFTPEALAGESVR